MSPGSITPHRSVRIRRWPASQAETSASCESCPATMASRSAGNRSGVTPGATTGSSPGGMTVTAGAAQQRPPQPAAITRASRPRRRTAASRAFSVSRAPTATPQLPVPTRTRSAWEPAAVAARSTAAKLSATDVGEPSLGALGDGLDRSASPARRVASSRSPSPGLTRPTWRPSTSTTGAIAQLKPQSRRSSVNSPSAVVPSAATASRRSRAASTSSEPSARQDTPTHTRTMRRPGSVIRSSG